MPREMHLGSQAIAAILGGPGIFYLWHSFYVPEDAMRAVLFLGAATVINLMLYPGSKRGQRLAALQKLAAKLIEAKKRR